jgi:outer membrane protein assembly factor BamD (BamD/ComL family)
MNKHIILFCTVVVLFLGGCASLSVRPSETPKFDINTATGLYNEAKYYLKYKDYNYAQRSFATLVDQFPKDALADDAQFMVAEILSNPTNKNQDLESAFEEYKNLIKNYPDSPFIKKAQKKVSELEKKLKKS